MRKASCKVTPLRKAICKVTSMRNASCNVMSVRKASCKVTSRERLVIRSRSHSGKTEDVTGDRLSEQPRSAHHEKGKS